MFYPGQIIRHKTNRIIGAFIKRYKVTGAGYSIRVMCMDGREYYAPEEQWEAV